MLLAAPLLLIKCVAQIASGAFIVSLGKPTAMAVLTGVGAVTNLALNFIFIPRYGLDGAVYSTLIGHTAMGLLTLPYVLHHVRQVHLNPELGAA